MKEVPTMKAMCRAALALAAVAAIAGCFGYRAGTLLPAHLRSIAVPTFGNETGEPNLEFLATSRVIRRLNVDGTLSVVPEDRADLLLKATLVEYTRRALRFENGNVPIEYRLTVGVRATLKDKTAGTNLWTDKVLRGSVDFPAGADLPTAERAAASGALDDLSHDIVEAIVEGWE